ncbi:hypothetical protein [Methanobrevibacter sp. DSM 116169]|uniref:hypothetical protein n=1 Tax=Methanobrevibacter sp. DSM 116169 TaxID=3242727 RepID=UPI0038FBED4A
MGKDGNNNEKLLISNIHDKKFSSLNNNLQNFVENVFKYKPQDTTKIECFKKAGFNKSDLIIKINEQEYGISVKKGSGNSVHQEKVNDFITFLKDNYDIPNQLSEDILFFIWGDGTLNGSGKVSDRMKANTIKEKYPQVVDNIKKFFYLNKKDLIERFVIKGAKSNSRPDYIYYGTPDAGKVVDSKTILDWLCDDINESKKAPIPVGRLTFQAWNRNINGGNKSEQKRGEIQLKWGSIGKDLDEMI